MLTYSLVQRFKWSRIQNLAVFCSRYIADEREPPSFQTFSRQLLPSLPAMQIELVKKPPERIRGSRVLQVAILGVPNAGKSTLVNQVSGWNTCAVSKKVHTTKKTSKTVLVKDETQIVFLDTPGLVVPTEAKQHNLETSFLIDPERALAQADLLIVLHDVSNKWTRDSLSPKILRLLHLYPDKESILVLNKIDLLKEKRLLLRLTNKLSQGIIGGQLLNGSDKSAEERRQVQESTKLEQETTHAYPTVLSEKAIAQKIEGMVGWPNFSNVFMVSAIDGDGVAEIMAHLFQAARPGRWIYNSSVVTDQNPHEIATAIVRGKLLDLLNKELPYSVKVSIQCWEEDLSGTLNIVMELDCLKPFTARVVIGTAGRTVVRLAKETEQELRNMFRQEVRLRLVVLPNI